MRSTCALAASPAFGLAAPAAAHHVVWIDFSGFDLSAWSTVNGNTPPTSSDQTAIEDLIFKNMTADFATFDIHLVRFEPTAGRFTQVEIVGSAVTDANGTTFGCAGGSCCQFGNCTGLGSWTESQSGAEIYAGSFAGFSDFNGLLGVNATTARIANGISHTASHELGHVLGLTHCHSADDFISSGTTCSDGFASTADTNVNWHIMASGASTSLTMAQRATRDRFFSVHSSRRVLYKSLQPRNHWKSFGSVNSDDFADLSYTDMSNPQRLRALSRPSTGSSFVGESVFNDSAGGPGAFRFIADVTGDGRGDLVLAIPRSRTTIQWVVFRSLGNAFGSSQGWSADAGDVGDILRLADVNGDGREDLLYGEPNGSTVPWFVRLSTGSSFGSRQTFSNDAGSEGDLFLLGDVNEDGRSDLVAVTPAPLHRVTTYYSTGTSFLEVGNVLPAFFDADYLLLDDVTGDGKANLVVGTVEDDTEVRWDVTDDCNLLFDLPFDCDTDRWANDAGDAGDLFRLGDGDGDGRADLFYGRRERTTLPWFGRLSTGSSFAAFTTWVQSAGVEGSLFP